MKKNELLLRYGCNPHQIPARAFIEDFDLPFQVLNGIPGYINLLDALNSWKLVKELKQAIDIPAAASFKHVSPSGVGVGLPLSTKLKTAYFVKDLDLSPIATAYARARGCDRLSSFGDWIALSDPVDLSTAKLISQEVSDGVIAPDYETEALKILSKKKSGKYAILKIDPQYQPKSIETRQVYGVTLEQPVDDHVISRADFDNIVTKNKSLTERAKRDMIIAWCTLKYTQSNSVCYVLDGQTIGVGAGQQSRIHCTRLAGEKANIWWLRQHPTILDMNFKPRTSRQMKDNLIDQFIRYDVKSAEHTNWKDFFEDIPNQIKSEEKIKWLNKLKNVTLGSDAFFPFRDSIDRAVKIGVKYVLQPGGSTRDDAVIKACDEYDLVMVFTGVRLFHH